MKQTTRTSVDGMLAILADEAVVLSTYKDGGGVATIGVGHTAAAGLPVPMSGLKLTLRQALKLFIEDLRKFELGVMKAFNGPLNQHEFDGFVSFHFNTGKAEKGTVDDKWDRGDKDGAMRTLRAYKKDNGKTIKGLEERRKREAELILTGTYPRVTSVLVADGWRGGSPVKARRVPADEIKAVLREIAAQRKTVEFDAPAPAEPPSPAPSARPLPPAQEAPQSPAIARGEVKGGGAVVPTAVLGGGSAIAWLLNHFGPALQWLAVIIFMLAVLVAVGLLAAKKEKAP